MTDKQCRLFNPFTTSHGAANISCVLDVQYNEVLRKTLASWILVEISKKRRFVLIVYVCIYRPFLLPTVIIYFFLSPSGGIISICVPSIAPTTYGIAHSVKMLNFWISSAVSLPLRRKWIKSPARETISVQNLFTIVQAVEMPTPKTLLAFRYEFPVHKRHIAKAILFSIHIDFLNRVFLLNIFSLTSVTTYSNVSGFRRNSRTHSSSQISS